MSKIPNAQTGISLRFIGVKKSFSSIARTMAGTANKNYDAGKGASVNGDPRFVDTALPALVSRSHQAATARASNVQGQTLHRRGRDTWTGRGRGDRAWGKLSASKVVASVRNAGGYRLK